MKLFIKILVVFAVGFFAYDYYKKNYTVEGKKQVVKDNEQALKDAEAERLRERDNALNSCRAIYTQNLSEGEKWNQYQVCEANVNSIYGTN